MSRVGVQQVVADLGLAQVDGAAFDRLYDEVTRDLLAQQPIGAVASLVSVTKDTATYSLPTDVVRVLSYFWGDYGIDEARESDLPSNWRGRRGRPFAVVTENEVERTIRLYPIPDRTSGDFVFLFGDPLGLDYPADALGIVATQLRNDYATSLDLPIGLLVLSRYHMEEGRDRSSSFAKACEQMGKAALAGVFAGADSGS